MGAFSSIGGLFHIGALALLLLATVTSPVTQQLFLAQDVDYRFGVFGYCNTARGVCSKAAASYKVSSISNADDYLFDNDKRDTLSKILIVFPVACGVTFISFIFALINTKKARSMVLSILSIIISVLAFLAATLACIIAFLIFYPHIKWLTWIQIGSAVFNLIAMVFMIIDTKLSNSSTGDITSMDYTLKDNLIDEKDNNFQVNAFSVPQPPKNFNTTNSNFRSPLNINSSDESSLTERKSINDMTVQQDRFGSSTSAFTNPSQLTQLHQTEPSIYKGPLGSSIRSEAPIVIPEIAEPQREPTLPQIENPYQDITLEASSSHPNALNVGDDRNIVRAETLESYTNDVRLDDINSLEADSDFTSISRRAVNPKYYRGAQNLPPNQAYQPQQQSSQYAQMPPLSQQQFGPLPQQYMIPQNPYSTQQQMQQQQQFQLPSSQLHHHHQHAPFGRRPPKPNPSDIILQNNPSFMLSQGVARQQMTRFGKSSQPPQPVPRMGQNYKNKQLRTQLPPASLARDSPYGGFVGGI